MERLRIEYHSVKDLQPYEQNVRKHQNINPLIESIKRFGFNVPLLVDEDMTIVAGHARFEAAKEMGLEEVPVIILRGLSEKDIAQFRIVDNKTSDLSSWDYEKLTFEMDSVPEIDFSVFGLNNGEDDEDGEGIAGSLDEGVELDLDEYEDDQFEFECPYCGFKWNE